MLTLNNDYKDCAHSQGIGNQDQREAGVITTPTEALLWSGSMGKFRERSRSSEGPAIKSEEAYPQEWQIWGVNLALQSCGSCEVKSTSP